MRPADNRWWARIAALIALGCSSWGWTAHPQPLSLPQDARDVRIGVLSLFHPRELVLRPADGEGLVIEVGDRRRPLSGDARAVVTIASGGGIQVRFGADGGSFTGTSLRAYAESNSESKILTRFLVEVPEKLRRQYAGIVEIRAKGTVLEAVVTMPLETAVASVVEAESPPGAGMEALKAQAVAARSFLVARQAAHAGFDFCDTTHCQFLRSPPQKDSRASEAARATAGLILTWHDEGSAQDRTVAAMYARSCGGRTRTLEQIGAHAAGYPYYAVRCAYCSRHPEIWRRELSVNPRTEQERLAFNRIHGWGAIPSVATDDVAPMHGASTSGRGTGHGIGLCQLGAAEMARQGASFAAILAHYYPNTRLAAADPS